MAEKTQLKPGDVGLESELEATAKDSDCQSEIKSDNSNPLWSTNGDSEMPHQFSSSCSGTEPESPDQVALHRPSHSVLKVLMLRLNRVLDSNLKMSLPVCRSEGIP